MAKKKITKKASKPKASEPWMQDLQQLHSDVKIVTDVLRERISQLQGRVTVLEGARFMAEISKSPQLKVSPSELNANGQQLQVKAYMVPVSERFHRVVVELSLPEDEATHD